MQTVGLSTTAVASTPESTVLYLNGVTGCLCPPLIAASSLRWQKAQLLQIYSTTLSQHWPRSEWGLLRQLDKEELELQIGQLSVRPVRWHEGRGGPLYAPVLLHLPKQPSSCHRRGRRGGWRGLQYMQDTGTGYKA